MSPLRRTVFVSVLAVLGIVLAAAITWGTSRLVSQHIGLSSEPVTAGLRLLPRPARPAPGESSGSRSPSKSTTTPPGSETPALTTTAPAVTTTTPGLPTTTPGVTTSPGAQAGEGSSDHRDSSARGDD